MLGDDRFKHRMNEFEKLDRIKVTKRLSRGIGDQVNAPKKIAKKEWATNEGTPETATPTLQGYNPVPFQITTKPANSFELPYKRQSTISELQLTITGNHTDDTIMSQSPAMKRRKVDYEVAPDSLSSSHLQQSSIFSWSCILPRSESYDHSNSELMSNLKSQLETKDMKIRKLQDKVRAIKEAAEQKDDLIR